MCAVQIHLNAVTMDRDLAVRQLQNYHELMMAAHLRGLHPYGRMRRDCPLCVQIDKTLGSER